MSLEELLHEAARLSHDAAFSPQWVQASGGNVSVKSEAEDLLVVKASGLRFSEVTPHHGLANLRLSAVRKLLDDASFDALDHFAQQDRAGRELAAAVLPGCQARPSLETGLHALGKRVALHTHPIALAAALSMRDGKALAMDLAQGLGQGVAWADLRPPGYSLARCIQQALISQPGASLILLENHGLVAYGDSVDEVLELTRELLARCHAAFGQTAPPSLKGDPALLEKVREHLRRFLTQELGAPHGHTAVASDPYAISLAVDEAWAWEPVVADDVIFCGMQVPLLSPEEALDGTVLKAIFKGAPHRLAVAVRGHGVVAAAAQPRALEYMLELLHANALIRAMTRSRGETRALSPKVCAQVAGMEGERYRQRLVG